MKKITVTNWSFAALIALFPQLSAAEVPTGADGSTISIVDQLTLTEDLNQYIAKQDANVRVGPNAAFDTAGIIHSGDIIEPLGRARSWVAFEKDGQTVFVWDGLLNKWMSWPSSTVETSQ